MRPRKSLAKPIALWTALTLFVTGCRYTDELLDDPEPAVDPRSVFPSLADSASFSGSSDSSLCDAPGEYTPRLNLGGLFTAELPQGEGWVTGSTGRAALLVHYGATSVPSAFLYAERIESDRIGLALRRFQARVDHSVKQIKTPKALAALGIRLGDQDDQEASEEAESSPTTVQASSGNDEQPPQSDGEMAAQDSVEPILEASTDSEPATQATPETETAPPNSEPSPLSAQPEENQLEAEAGLEDSASEAEEAEALETLAPGYASDQGTFTGWQWIGTCRPGDTELAADLNAEPLPSGETMKPFLRFGRTQGNWRRQPGAEPIPAFLILATVTLPERRNYGVHVAVVCTEPQCEVDHAFARLLGSIRVASLGPEAGVNESWESDPFQELANEVGIAYRPRVSN